MSLSNKKQKLTHNQPTCTNDVKVDDEPNFLVQRYRFNTVALPAIAGDSPLATSGAFHGIFSVALKAPHDPNKPSLLVVFDDDVEDSDSDTDEDPFCQIETSALSDKSPVQQFYKNTKTVVYFDPDDHDTVEVDFSFHNGSDSDSDSDSDSSSSSGSGSDSESTTSTATTTASTSTTTSKSENIAHEITCTTGTASTSSSTSTTSKSEIIEMITSRDQLATMVANRGGYLELKANPNPSYGASVCAGFAIPHHLKLYCVIATKPLPSFTELQLTGVHFRKPDAISFWTLMLGTHKRLGVNAPYFLNIEGLNRNVFSYLRLKCDFASLERRVATWMLNSPYSASLWGNLNARDLVREYRRFLLLKTRAEDWTSQRLSPPMQNDAMTGYRLLDEVWHLHLSSPNYGEDIQLFTEGHQIQHHPVLRSDAEPRYVVTRALAVEDVKNSNELHLGGSKKGDKFLTTSDEFKRMWPEIVEDFVEDESNSDDYYANGGYPSDGCC